MQILTRLFFEDIVLLLLAEFVALAIMLAIHRKRFTPQSRRNVWLTLGICASLLGVQYLVETDTEKLRSLVKQLVDAADEGKIDIIAEMVHPEGVRVGMGVDADNYPKDVFVMGCNIGLQIHRIHEAQVGGIKIELNGDRATVGFYVNCEISSSAEGNVGFTQSIWEILYIKTPDGWKMRQILKGEMGLAVMSNVPRTSVLRYIREMNERALNASP